MDSYDENKNADALPFAVSYTFSVSHESWTEYGKTVDGTEVNSWNFWNSLYFVAPTLRKMSR